MLWTLRKEVRRKGVALLNDLKSGGRVKGGDHQRVIYAERHEQVGGILLGQ